jgi:putative FmdB family regulatory protein
MPIFDYLCKNCEEIHADILVKRFDTVTECPTCKKEMQRLLSRPAFKFKQPGGVDRGHTISIAKRK